MNKEAAAEKEVKIVKVLFIRIRDIYFYKNVQVCVFGHIFVTIFIEGEPFQTDITRKSDKIQVYKGCIEKTELVRHIYNIISK